MADRIELREGNLPWKPGGAESVAVLNKYDMPLSGVIIQHGTPFFFWCIRGEVTQGTLWGYVPIGEHERHEIEHEPRDQVVRRLLKSKRPCTLAFSIEGQGIVKWRDFESQRSIQEWLHSGQEERILELTPEEQDLLETV
jgi:hypothetical protein